MEEWQRVCRDKWQFGEKIRGIVRHPRAVVVLKVDEWHWFAFKVAKGTCNTRTEAIEAAERALGIGG